MLWNGSGETPRTYWKMHPRARSSDSPGAPRATAVVQRLSIRGPSTALTAAPRKGSRATSQRKSSTVVVSYQRSRFCRLTSMVRRLR